VRILHAVWNYPQLSETYIAAEIAFALRAGADVRVWSTIARHPAHVAQCRVHRGTLAAAIEDAAPDVVHFHYLVLAQGHLHEVPPGVPVTVRGHSFDWSPALCRQVAAHPAVRRVYLFPHFAALAADVPKVCALPVSYDSSLHVPSPAKDLRLVVRTAAGLPTKGLDDFFAAARLAPDHRFVLAAARCGGADEYLEGLARLGGKGPGKVEVLIDVPCREAAELVARAGIYLETHDPRGHAFGMPVSMAEAWATGSHVLTPDVPAARAYASGTGALYRDPEEAAWLIRETLSWDGPRWEASAAAALARARAFRDDAVLPALIADWTRLAEKR
jgi:glycosyltransferase involved in cell wall biosynthesis